jgi:hypothetical protein
MNIYEIKSQGEREWICAHTIFEALKFYHSLNDLEISDFDDEDDIIIIPEDKWGEFNVIDPDDLDENEEAKVIHTFAERMKDQTVPDIIASTVY